MMWHPSESAAPMKVQGCSISKVQARQNSIQRQEILTAGLRAGSLKLSRPHTGGKERAKLTASCFAAV